MSTPGAFVPSAIDATARRAARANVPWVGGEQAGTAPVTASRNATAADAGAYQRFNNAGALNYTFTAAEVAGMPDNTVIEFEQAGAGAVTVVASGVTINSRGGAMSTAGQFAVAAIRKVGPLELTLTGDVA